VFSIVEQVVIKYARVSDQLPHTVGLTGVPQIGNPVDGSGGERGVLLDTLGEFKSHVGFNVVFNRILLGFVEFGLIYVEVLLEIAADLVKFDVVVTGVTLETGFVQFG